MYYEWDEQKRSTNIDTHKVDFEAIRKFDWATCLTVPDERHSEERYLSLGLIGRRLHAVAYTWRDNAIRIISLRKANQREVNKYEDFISKK